MSRGTLLFRWSVPLLFLSYFLPVVLGHSLPDNWPYLVLVGVADAWVGTLLLKQSTKGLKIVGAVLWFFAVVCVLLVGAAALS